MANYTWTETEINYLKENYTTKTKDEVCAYLNKTWKAVNDKALTLGLKLMDYKRPWTGEELGALKAIYKTQSKDFILQKIPEKTWKGIRGKAVQLGLKRDPAIIKQDNLINSQKGMLEKHGVKSSFSLESTQQKIKEQYQEKYQVDYPQQALEIKEKTKQNNLEKYGCHPAALPEIQAKTVQTNLSIYGVERPLQNKSVHDKVSETNLAVRGVINPFQSPEVQEKIRIRNLENLGCENPMDLNTQHKILIFYTKCLKHRNKTTPYKNLEVK